MMPFRDVWQGKSLVRSLMNREVARRAISGLVVDIGAGHHPDYQALFLKRGLVTFKNIDLKDGVDIEREALPIESGSADVVIMFNLLEHVYRHAFVVGESRRILKSGATLYGFVPFLVQYHPDPHDYFRYTREALERLLTDAGYEQSEVKEIGGGPFAANYNNLVLSMPRVLRVLLLPIYLGLDRAFLALRPAARRRYPLGYFFTAHAP